MIRPHTQRDLRTLLTVGIGLFGSLTLSTAQAQDTAGFDAHDFHLAAFDGDPRDPILLQRPGRINQLEWFAGGLFEFADAPLVYSYADGTEDTALDDVLALNLSAGVAVHDHVRLDLAVPLYFTSTGALDASQGAGIGDLRLSAMGLLVRPGDDGGFGLGLVPWLTLPTGDDAAFLGSSGLGGGAKAAATMELSKLTLSGDLGAQFNPALDLDNLTGSDSLLAGLGVGYLINDTTGLNGEIVGAAPFEASTESGTTTRWEGILSFRKRTEAGAHFAGGFATAISRGAGTPAFRVFLGGGWGRIGERVVDTDLDGILDKVDACPEEPETVNDWKDTDGCPDDLAHVKVVVTKDGSRIAGASVDFQGPDGSSAFKSNPDPDPITMMPGSSVSGTATWSTCLGAQGSLDSVPEGSSTLTLDLQRTLEGQVRYEVHTRKGKPIAGATVSYIGDEPACYPPGQIALADDGTGMQPVGAGTYDVLVSAPNYGIWRGELTVEDGKKHLVEVTLKKARTRIEKKQIVILDKVYFETAKAVIKSESYDLLNEVANVLIANPQIKRIEIAGHTDSRGNNDYNLDLSDARARSVQQYLVDKGVAVGRLQARGYGESNPIDTNRTSRGRANNRRVEFNILETAEVEEEE